MVSETPKSQLKVFLGLIWPTSDSINMVGWPGSLGMSFFGDKWVKLGLGSLFGFDFIGF